MMSRLDTKIHHLMTLCCTVSVVNGANKCLQMALGGGADVAHVRVDGTKLDK